MTANLSELRSPASASCRDAAGMASALIPQPLGLTTAASAPRSRSDSWAALVTAWSRQQLSTLDWALS